MKKLLFIMLAAIIALLVAACGPKPAGVQTDSTDTTVSADSSSPLDYSAILSGNSEIIISKLGDKEKQLVIDAAKESDIEVTFNSDGSTSLLSSDGSSAVQNADGSWTFNEKSGDSISFGNKWPEGELAKAVPTPDFGSLVSAVEENDSFTASISGVSIADVRAYADKVISAGFSIESDLTDQEMLGTNVYTYSAKDSNGYTVELAFTMGILGIIVNK